MKVLCWQLPPISSEHVIPPRVECIACIPINCNCSYTRAHARIKIHTHTRTHARTCTHTHTYIHIYFCDLKACLLHLASLVTYGHAMLSFLFSWVKTSRALNGVTPLPQRLIQWLLGLSFSPPPLSLSLPPLSRFLSLLISVSLRVCVSLSLSRTLLSNLC